MQPYLIVNDMEVSPFDYMKQFWRENEVQMFSAKETQLYFFFLSESNRLYWRNPFGCSTQRITNNLGISRQTLCRLRKKLQDRGLIRGKEQFYSTLLWITDKVERFDNAECDYKWNTEWNCECDTI